MSRESRYLITTADEKTWKFDRSVIFLGEWCRNYERQHVWEKMDAIVARPFGLGKTRIDNDIAQTNLIKDALFPILCEILNQTHKVNHTERFWKIILGHWFNEYVATILNRVLTLQQCLNDYNISGVTGFCAPYQSLCVPSFVPFWYEALESPRWNSILYSRILETMSIPNLIISNLPLEPELETTEQRTEINSSKQRGPKSYAFSILRKLAPLLAKRGDAFIVSSYLPPKYEIYLQILLGQFPSFWVTPSVKIKANPDTSLRNELTHVLFNDSDHDLMKMVKTFLFEMLPIAYLEGFSEIQDIARKQKWPDKPKFIFTSNAFYSNDVLKYWIAKQVDSGVCYIVGQHGNSYFTDRRRLNWVEEVTPDKFLTWGWNDDSGRYLPAFVFQNNPRKPRKINPSGGLLLINTGPGISRTCCDVASVAHQYLEMNQTFIQSLVSEPREQTTLRLDITTREHPFSEKKRWLAFDPNLKIDEGHSPINQLISENRLIVHGYDSTGILLTLSENIPTIAFWLNGFDHLNDNVIDDYKLLVEVGIIHFTPESAAKKVNEIWPTIDDWWRRDEVQIARKEFCEKYARGSKHPARDLKKILLRVAKN